MPVSRYPMDTMRIKFSRPAQSNSDLVRQIRSLRKRPWLAFLASGLFASGVMLTSPNTVFAAQDEVAEEVAEEEGQEPSAASRAPKKSEDVSAMVKDFSFRAVGPTSTGGRIIDVEVDPANPFKIFAASASGGLWVSENNGTTWSCIFENEGTISIGDICLDPNDSNTIWVGTGEANNQRSSYWGDGIYKSTDGGETWKNMGLPDSHHIGRVVIDPFDSDVVYVAAAGHLYTPNEERGLFKTSDGGETWEKVLYINPDVGVIDVVLDPQRPSTIYAAAYERRRRAWDFDGNGPGSAIYRSQNGGKNWEKLGAGLPGGDIGRIGLAISQQNPRVVYASVANQNQEGGSEPDTKVEAASDGQYKLPIGITIKFLDGKAEITDVERNSRASSADIARGQFLIGVGGSNVSDIDALTQFFEHLSLGDSVQIDVQDEEEILSFDYVVSASAGREVGGEVYRTDDGGNSWEKVNERPAGGSPAYYYGQIRIDPNNDENLWMLSVPVYRSTDGGKTWAQDGAPSVHVDHHALWINPNNSKHMILGNDGGLHISYDSGDTWDHVYNLPLAQFYAIGADMQDPYHVYGGTQDNGTWGGPSSGNVGRNSWYRVGGGDGFYVQPDPTNSDIVIGESQFGAIYRLDKEAGRTQSIRPPQTEPDGARDRYNWNSPIVISSHDPRVIYFGGNKLFKSFNQGDEWLVISPDLTTATPEWVAGNVPHCTITTISESPLDRKKLLVGTDDGKVQWTNDGGETWIDMSDRFPLRPELWWCSRVELSAHDDKTAYVSFTRYREDDFRPFVFVTHDSGESWHSLSAGLPMGSVNVIKEDPKRAQTLYLGTEFGAFVSLDGGDNWLAITNGIPRVPVHDLLVHPRENDLIVGTHARGIFIIDDISPWQQIPADMKDKAAYLFNIDSFEMPTFRFGRGGGGGGLPISGDRKWMSESEPSGTFISYFLADKVDGDIKLEIYNEANDRVAELEAPNEAGINRVAWNVLGAGRRGRGGRGGFGGRRGAGGGGPQIGPGFYWAVLTIGEEELEAKFEIKPVQQ